MDQRIRQCVRTLHALSSEDADALEAYIEGMEAQIAALEASDPFRALVLKMAGQMARVDSALGQSKEREDSIQQAIAQMTTSIQELGGARAEDIRAEREKAALLHETALAAQKQQHDLAMAEIEGQHRRLSTILSSKPVLAVGTGLFGAGGIISFLLQRFFGG